MHLRCDFFAESLSLATSMTVLLPQQTSRQVGLGGVRHDGAPPVLYLLHGMSDDDTSWLRRTSIERYVSPLGWAVVMPQVHRSYYTDEIYGQHFWRFISEELPALVAASFAVSTRREDTFVAGLSMGGYGAMKLAFRQRERFAAAASLSGAVDIRIRADPAHPRGDDPMLATRVFGPDHHVEDADDVFWHLEQAQVEGLPDLFVACGTEDVLLGENRRFVKECRSANVPVTSKFDRGRHEWAYWDAKIQEAIAFFAERRAAQLQLRGR